MSLRNWKRVVASATLAAAVGLAVDGCSSGSSSSNGDGDAAAEASHPPPHHLDAGFSGNPGNPADAGDDGSVSFDDTTGMPCLADAECSPKGFHRNKCTISGYFTDGPVYPTPVCLPVDSCNPGTDGFIHFCDGPDNASSKGICLATATPGSGDCYPKCIIPGDGSPATGCQGRNNVCRFYVPAIDTRGQVVGLGFCSGGCVADADCPGGSKCQKDDGICVTTLKPPAKQLGQACSASDPAGTCVCYRNSSTGGGYCTQFCIVGPSSPAPCPSGYLCDARLPAQVTSSATDATMTGFTTQNGGLSGFCFQDCSASGTPEAGAAPNSDAGADAGGDSSSDAFSEASVDGAGDGQVAPGCPGTATCSSRHTVGSVCLP